MSCHIDDESPTRYLTGRGILCLPKQEKEKYAIIDYSNNPYSPAKYPAVGQKGKLETKKQNAENKPKTKKIKKEAGVNSL